MNIISPRELHARYQEDATLRLLDVRTPAEYREAHVPFAENWPLESLDVAAVTQDLSKSSCEPVYMICQKGGRGASACAKLLAAGLRDVVNVDGGTSAWEQSGLPLARGKKTISLERQVRIAAGLIVLCGCALGYFVNPYWYGLAAFVGAGLTFSGVTDTCGMGMLLARMPWNQVKNTANSQVACSKG